MSAGFWAYGTQMQIGDGAVSEVFATVAEVMDITGPQATRDQIDMFNHDSPDGYEDILPTVKRSGNVTFQVNLIPANATQNGSTGLASLYDSGRRCHMKIIMPDEDDSEITFDAYVMGFSVTFPTTGPGRAAVTIKPVGKITWF